MKSSYFLIDSFKPIESFDNDNIDFIKFYFNTHNVIRLNHNQYNRIFNIYQDYIINLTNILNNNRKEK